MDPLSILGVAAAVAQFVDIGIRTLAISNEIAHSSTGKTAENETRESIVASLLAVSEKLDLRVSGPPYGRLPVKKRSPQEEAAQSLLRLSSQCKKDCQQFLAVLEDLKFDNQEKGRVWGRLKAGLKTVWEERKIRDFEQRMKATQDQMFLHLGVFITDEISRLSLKIQDMKSENTKAQLDQSTQLELMSRELHNLRLDMDESENDGKPRALQRMDPVAMIESFQSRFESFHSRRFELQKQQAILASLNFKSRPVRHETIPEPYARTFRWIFQSELSTWLASGSGIFWVTGRAGSGKSTLMKFLADNPDTIKALTNWGKPKTAVVVAHYFWSAGTHIQRSQNGLLQTLLYEIFKKCPDCIPITCPSRWKDAGNDLFLAKSQPWSIAELHETLTSLGFHENLPTKFCFLIDGLDEFEGDHTDLCDILVGFSRSPNFKLCLASRPLNAFEEAFESYKRFLIHELTQDDITAFAEDRLKSHPKWESCTANENDRIALIHNIRDRAHGVFLWVFLVVNSLRKGLTNEDDIEELQERLRVLPTQLESLFKHMLQSADPVYQKKQAANLLLALEAREPLELDIFGFQDNEYRDSQYAINWPIQVIPDAELRQLRRKTRKRINARSQGLLEVRQGHVEYLHRTVRDFLRTESINQYLKSEAPQGFDAKLSITKAYLAKIKSEDYSSGGIDDGTGIKTSRPVVRHSPGNNAGLLMRHLEECMYYASAMNHDLMPSLHDIVEELERAVEVMFSAGQAKFFTGHCPPRLLVRETAILTACDEYMSYEVDILGRDYFSMFNESPLFVPAVAPGKALAMVPFLLEHGVDPNVESADVKKSSPWVTFISRVSPFAFLPSNSSAFAPALKSCLFTAFLRAGADSNARHPGNGLTAFAIFLFAIFAKDMPIATSSTSSYLLELESFLSHGADVAAEIPLFEYQSPVSESVNLTITHIVKKNQEKTTVIADLFRHLKQWYRVMEAARKTLAESTVRMIIAKARLDAQNHQQLEEMIRESFPAKVASSLTRELTMRSIPSRPVKRPIDAVMEGEGGREKEPGKKGGNRRYLQNGIS